MKVLNRILLSGLATAALCFGGLAQATLIDFDSQGFSGPCCFGGPAETRTVILGGYRVVFTGGVILTNTSNLPADQTSVYGTASFGNAYSNPLTVSFFDAITNAPRNISNFFLDVLNGNVVNIDYTVADNLGHSQTVNLAPNLSSGAATIGFAAAGNVVTIFAAPSTVIGWDFFIDNIHFNEQLPGTAPEPGTLALLGIAILGFAIQRRLKHRR